MSEWIIETKFLDSDGSSQVTVGRSSGRIRSISEAYSIDSCSFDNDSVDSRKNSEDGKFANVISPVISSGHIIGNQGDRTPDCGEVISGSFVSVGSHRNLRASHETRGRLFSELSISDLPTDGGDSSMLI